MSCKFLPEGVPDVDTKNWIRLVVDTGATDHSSILLLTASNPSMLALLGAPLL